VSHGARVTVAVAVVAADNRTMHRLRIHLVAVTVQISTNYNKMATLHIYDVRIITNGIAAANRYSCCSNRCSNDRTMSSS